MIISDSLLSRDEKAIFALRSLYREHGFSQYRMNKFEEYDLYVENKDFLLSDNVITFTDTNGKLMALKPDVTLSIIKNCKDRPGDVQKVFYNENVYRVSKRTRSFREIAQAGLECIGDVDDYSVYEVLELACESLARISPDYVLDISQLDIVEGVMDVLGIPGEVRRGLLKCVGEKNPHGIEDICRGEGIGAGAAEALRELAAFSGGVDEALGLMARLPGAESFGGAAAQLGRIASRLDTAGLAGHIRIDFSVINDMAYYNGIVFSGFVDGIPSSILSGGQYDGLMRKMGLDSRAIGFAVYLDALEYLRSSGEDDGEDIVLLYEEGTPLEALCEAETKLRDEGRRVLVSRALPEKLAYRQLYRMTKDGVVTLG